MDNEEVLIKLTKHHEEIGSLKHRMDGVEEKMDVLNELAMSVKELAINMQAMLKEQEKQGQHIELLEAAPAKSWDTVKTVVLTAIVSTARRKPAGLTGTIRAACHQLQATTI